MTFAGSFVSEQRLLSMADFKKLWMYRDIHSERIDIDGINVWTTLVLFDYGLLLLVKQVKEKGADGHADCEEKVQFEKDILHFFAKSADFLFGDVHRVNPTLMK
jgi:hypothetical protein